MKIQTKTITTLGVLAALSVVLRAVTIYLAAYNRIVFHNIPIIIGSIYFGPLWGLALAFISDLSSAAYTPGWAFPFMIPQLFWGVMPGLLMKLWKKESIIRLYAIAAISYLCVSIGNTIVIAGVNEWNWTIAFGTVRLTNFGVSFMNFSWLPASYSLVIPARLLFVALIMLIKVPIDVQIIRMVQKRVFEPKLQLSYKS